MTSNSENRPPVWLVAPAGWLWCWATTESDDDSIPTGWSSVAYFEQRLEGAYWVGVPIIIEEGYVAQVPQWQLNVAEFGVERLDTTGEWWSCRLVGPQEDYTDVIDELVRNVRFHASGDLAKGGS